MAEAPPDAFLTWRDFFRHWPTEVERRGVLVTSYEEQIPFDGFLTADTLLLLERRTPDTSGARKIMIGYGSIVALKFTDVLKNRPFQAAGFVEPAGKKPAAE